MSCDIRIIYVVWHQYICYVALGVLILCEVRSTYAASH